MPILPMSRIKLQSHNNGTYITPISQPWRLWHAVSLSILSLIHSHQNISEFHCLHPRIERKSLLCTFQSNLPFFNVDYPANYVFTFILDYPWRLAISQEKELSVHYHVCLRQTFKKMYLGIYNIIFLGYIRFSI